MGAEVGFCKDFEREEMEEEERKADRRPGSCSERARVVSSLSLSSRVSAAAQGVLNYRSNGKNGRLR